MMDSGMRPYERRMDSTAFVLAVRGRVAPDRDLNIILLEHRLREDTIKWAHTMSNRHFDQ